MNKSESIRGRIIQKRLETPQQRIVEAKMRQREIVAREIGRIIPEKCPDLIGNFKNKNPTGIFEMFIDNKKENGEFSGTIEDCYGTATVKGRLSEDNIIFRKDYITEQSSVNAAKGGIIYQGEYCIPTDSYVGTFSFNDYPRVKHPFEVTKDPSFS